MPWNKRPPSIFHDESWSTLWRSTEFPPEETHSERYYRHQAGGWPRGWAIYRTSYIEISDEDWARAIEKLDQACLAGLEFSECWWSKAGFTHIEMIREGYRNIMFEDPTLEGASEAVIQRRHTQWVEDHGLYVCSAVPRLNYPLLLDERCVRSILASAEPIRPTTPQSEPRGMVGYVNVLDGDLVFEDRQEEDGEYYYGLVRAHLDCLFRFCINCENLVTEQDWGSWGMDNPNAMPYVDGRDLTFEIKEMFLSTSDRDFERTARITELEFKGNQ
ncbi:hypothetical protein N7517_007431 [Penicillium concentricum]|uniref:Uncharacterized protein n=1 Tax=Penicillium concentricum TaxID=293559 RepID=A0A9W9SBN5_9EURO|nr:uncharacterized protein N7517_007431 [Penicillium concentricum]KAJ5375425.1 hypothetical protein N7517_007431 [Penicillium concentricum]